MRVRRLYESGEGLHHAYPGKPNRQNVLSRGDNGDNNSGAKSNSIAGGKPRA